MDLQTHYILSATTALMIGSVQTAAYLTGRFGRWPLWWGPSNALYGASTIAIALAPTCPITVMVANVGTIAAWLLLLGGVRAFGGRALPGWSIVAALGGIALAISLRAPVDFGLRLPLISGLAAAFDLAIACEAVRLARREDLRSGWIMAALFGISAVMMLVRAGLVLADPGRISLFGQGSVAEALLVVPVTALLILRDTILVLLAAERNHVDMAAIAYRDPLTAALSRRGFRQAKEMLLRHTANHPVRAAVLVIDVDHFKHFNDRCGHAVGDALLCAVANAAHRVAPRGGLVSRWGGDEFVVLLPGTSGSDAVGVANALTEAFMEEARATETAGVRPTLSIGVAEGPLDADRLPELLKLADQALYAVKGQGRAGVRLAAAASVSSTRPPTGAFVKASGMTA
ncbi:GGDEF domain-containing protein [Methylobacterium sp. D54C]